jgi:hypothetical protein
MNILADQPSAQSTLGLAGQLVLAGFPIILGGLLTLLRAQLLIGGRRFAAPSELRLGFIRWRESQQRLPKGTAAVRARQLRRVQALLAIAPTAYLSLLVWTGLGLGNVVRIIALVAYVPATAILITAAALLNPRLADQSAFPPGATAIELAVWGDPDDLVHHLQRLLLRRGSIILFERDPSSGSLLVTVLRFRLRLTLLIPQYIHIVGTLHDDAMSTLAIMSYSGLPYRTDFGACFSTVRRVVRSFAIPSRPEPRNYAPHAEDHR